jgi:hypothetical protein
VLNLSKKGPCWRAWRSCSGGGGATQQEIGVLKGRSTFRQVNRKERVAAPVQVDEEPGVALAAQQQLKNVIVAVLNLLVPEVDHRPGATHPHVFHPKVGIAAGGPITDPPSQRMRRSRLAIEGIIPADWVRISFWLA